MNERLRLVLAAGVSAVLVVPLVGVLGPPPASAAGPQGQTTARLIGEVERLGLNNPADPFSGGTMVVGGQLVTLPRNLLYDLPANRLSLTELFKQAPAGCLALKESGLSKADVCNLSKTGAIATVEANRTSGGNVIAGDVFLQKGAETLNGTVTFLDTTNGFYRLNGNVGDSTTGVMVRLNDPTSKHTVQQGPGCLAGSQNCSADPRFTLDPENYTNAFATGYPLCLPSTTPRTFVDALDLNSNGNTTETLTTKSDAAGVGDLLCPDANRSAAVDPLLGQQAVDSRRFAPVQVGDSVIELGNFETINGVRFLSAHTTKVSRSISTKSASDPTQPDYVILNSMFIDAPGFFRERSRDLFLGATTAVDSDVVVSTVHRDPATNSPHEFPLASVVGCENAAGALSCRRVLGPNTFRVRHDVDFAVGAAPSLNPCTQINADPRFAGKNICQGRNNDVGEMFGMMSPIPREVQLRTGVEMADLARPTPLLKAVDVHAADSKHGQYLFPMGVGLGGVEFPAFAEINPNLLNNPGSLSGLPWALDRRLSPTGCLPTGCETTPQPLDPFPFEGFDPRQPGLGTPQGNYTDPNYTASLLTNERNRMLSFVDPTLKNFNGDSTVLAWPPVDPPAQPILPTPSLNGTNGAPVARDDAATVANNSSANNVDVLGNDTPGGTPFNFAGVTISNGPTNGTVTQNPANGVVSYTPNTGFIGNDTFQYTVSNTGGVTSNLATVTMTVSPPPAPAPVLSGFAPASLQVGQPVTISGTNLNFVASVSYPTAGIGTVSVLAAQFSSQPPSGLSLVVNVPAGATSGPITVTSQPGGTSATSSTGLIVTPAPPTLTSFTPSSGAVGDTVTVNGTNLNGVSLAFNGVKQPVVNTISPNQIKAVVPIGATTGPISVSDTGGTATSATLFTVLKPPPTVRQITTFSPNSGAAGQLVQVDGTGFLGLSAVNFNGVSTSFTPVDATRFFAAVPNGATSGRITITVGTAAVPVIITSPANFTVIAGPATAPGAPPVGLATAGNTTATLTWTAPVDGGSPITGYTVAATPIAGGPTLTVVAVATATQATVTGLTNSAKYTLKVQATNATGTGLFSAASNTVVPGVAPRAPTNVAATSGSTPGTISANVTWSVPTSRGSSPITSYLITALPTNGQAPRTLTVGPGARSLIFRRLVRNATYQFTVTAVNATGPGAPSAPSAVVTAR